MEKISVVESPNKISTYFDILRENDLEFAITDFRLRKMELMEDYVFNKTSLKNGKIVLEDVIMDKQTNAAKKEAKKNNNVTKTQALKDRIDKFIEMLKNFFKDVWARFMGKVDELLDRDKEWIAENQVRFDGITDNFWNACSITCYPYFGKGFDIFSKSIFTNGSGFQNINNDAVKSRIDEGFESDEAMRQYVCRNIHKIDVENFAEGAKTWFRGADKLRVYQKTDAHNMAVNFIDYCKNYKNTAVNIKKDLNDIEKMGEDLKKLYSQRGTTEAMISAYDDRLYSILENCYLWELPKFTELSLESADGVELSVISEEVTTNEAGENNNGEVKSDDKTVTDTSAETPGPTSKIFNNRMKYIAIAKIMSAARMTVAEECYKAGMRTLRAILNEASKRNEISTEKSVKTSQAKTAQDQAKQNAKSGEKLTSISDSQGRNANT